MTGIVIWALGSLVAFLLVVIGAMAFGHRQATAAFLRDFEILCVHIADERAIVATLIEQVDPACTAYHALERENAHLRGQLAETWGDPPTQLNLPQPEAPQIALSWDTKAADGLAEKGAADGRE